jgi:hypothetical protein
MTTRSSLLPRLFVLSWVALSPAAAKENRTAVDLDYVPRQIVGAVDLSALEGVPVALRLTDRRGLDDPARIGTRTDGRDRVHELRATEDLSWFLTDAMARILESWQIQVRKSATLKLDIEINSYEAQETNRAAGADYEAVVRLGLRLSEADRELWKGGVSASASRYGKKFSNDNVNEVLSDALLEALASVMATPELQDAWSRGGSARYSR